MYLSFVTSCCYPFGFPVCLCLVFWKHGCDMLTNLYTFDQGFIQPFVSGGVWNCQGHHRSAEGEGVSPPRDGVRGFHPGKSLKFETQFGAIWCIFGKKFSFLQLSTFVNENIAIMLDSGIDIVTYYFNLLVVRIPSVSCCSRRLACSGRVSWSSKLVLPWWGKMTVLLQGGGVTLFQGSSPLLRGGWIKPCFWPVTSPDCKG